MASKKNEDNKTEEKLRRLAEKIKKLEELQRQSPDEKAFGNIAGEILRSIGEMVPGLGGLIESISKSSEVRERLEKVDQELRRRLRETPLKKVEGEVSQGLTGRPMGIPPGTQGGGFSTTPKRKAIVKRKRPDRRLAAKPLEEISVDVFDEDGHMVVIAELPGVAEGEVEVKAQGRTLSIVVTTEGAKRSQEIELPSAVQGERQYSLNKGVLKIRLEKARNDD
ncbi:MAG: hypothetical protein AMS15_03750 [Planctomycetes bacterium DG_23]|nr:MAG: hypothetical protein AMS15_03750 [Planctomycetes bacterium DG_23]